MIEEGKVPPDTKPENVVVMSDVSGSMTGDSNGSFSWSWGTHERAQLTRVARHGDDVCVEPSVAHTAGGVTVLRARRFSL